MGLNPFVQHSTIQFMIEAVGEDAQAAACLVKFQMSLQERCRSMFLS